MTLKNIRLARTASQILFFVLLAAVLVGAFCSVSLGSGAYLTCSLGMLQFVLGTQEILWGTILSGTLLLILTIALGRVFCGWVCPFGTLLDWVQKPLARLRIARSKLPGWLIDPDTKAVKYGILGGTLLAAGLFRSPAFCTVCPVGTVCRTAGLQGVHLGLETAVLPLIVSMETVQKRFWCKALCPIGALLGIVSRFSPFKVSLPWNSCAGCNRCEDVCAMDNSPRYEGMAKMKSDPAVLRALIESGIPDALDRPVRPEMLPANVRSAVDAKNRRLTVDSSECTRCFDCVTNCPVLQGNESPGTVSMPGGVTGAVR